MTNSDRGLRDRDLVRLHWPRALRPAFDSLFAIDDAMASVVQNATQPALAAIKLAWWRERLEELDAGKVPSEPRLQAAAAELLPRGVRGADLAELEQGWAALLQPHADAEQVLRRGAVLFGLAARLIAGEALPLEGPGRTYAAGQLTRLGLLPDKVEFAEHRPLRTPRRYRPLTGLAVLAARDLRRRAAVEPEATPGRSWALLRHRFTGR